MFQIHNNRIYNAQDGVLIFDLEKLPTDIRDLVEHTVAVVNYYGQSKMSLPYIDRLIEIVKSLDDIPNKAN